MCVPCHQGVVPRAHCHCRQHPDGTHQGQRSHGLAHPFTLPAVAALPGVCQFLLALYPELKFGGSPPRALTFQNTTFHMALRELKCYFTAAPLLTLSNVSPSLWLMLMPLTQEWVLFSSSNPSRTRSFTPMRFSLSNYSQQRVTTILAVLVQLLLSQWRSSLPPASSK